MAEENENKAEEKDSGGGKRFVWPLILLAAMAAAVGAGYGLSGLFSSPAEANAAVSLQDQGDYPPDWAKGGSHGDYEYLDFAPITVNLNVPRLERYIRATIRLAIRKDDFDAASKVIEDRKPELRNWMIVYFGGCSLEDVRGPQKLNRLRREIRESLNEQLWPNGKPMIDQVLLNEFVVQ